MAPRRDVNAVNVVLAGISVLFQPVDPNPNDYVVYFNPSTGVLDPLMAKVLVLQNGQEKVAIIKLDTVGISRKLRDAMVAEAAQFGIPAKNVLVCGTHTHSGPGAVADKHGFELAAMDCFNQRVFDFLKQRITFALHLAHQNLQPAALGIESGQEFDCSKNRRGNPGIYDPEVGVIRVEKADGQNTPMAILLNFAVHGTCYYAGNMKFSGDCMGYCERYIEKKVGFGAVALFTNGAEGDVRPRGDAKQCGEKLAEKVLQIAQGIGTTRNVPLKGAFEDVRFPAPMVRARNGTGGEIDLSWLPSFMIALPLDDSWLPHVLPFQAIRIGDAVLAAVPGEPLTAVGESIKRAGKAAGFKYTYVVSLANDHMGYIADIYEYQKGGYESTCTFYGPDTGDRVVQNLTRQINSVRP
jgi:hypothetical protein